MIYRLASSATVWTLLASWCCMCSYLSFVVCRYRRQSCLLCWLTSSCFGSCRNCLCFTIIKSSRRYWCFDTVCWTFGIASSP